MKAEDLMIGNWVNSPYEFKPVKVLQVGDIVFYEIDEESTDSCDFFRLTEIPLTEEWLVKFGFDKLEISHYNRWLLNGFEIEVQGEYFAYVIWSEENPHTTHFIGHCKYVHQLQNLYFVLTGEELKLINSQK